MLKKLNKMMSHILGTSAAGSGRNLRRPRRFRPGIEGLEDRSVPATLLVNTFADNVIPDGFRSLREAVIEANRLPGPDTIRLQAGTYQISPASPNDTTGILTGDFDVTGSLTIVGAGAATIIQGNTLGARERLFEVLGPVKMSFVNLTLRNA